ncbi:MAG: RsmF rRNA methyltransferase first C-terminal domain-containing protein, partial [Anaerolineae bacterium]|nr:RsmF rRNA methyltransferase first C-terminal domain-containing protein [Anaerolineae bacterium]
MIDEIHWPVDFVNRMRGWLGAEAEDFLIALAKRDVGLRLNPLRGDLHTLVGLLDWQVEPVPWCPEGVWLHEDVQVGTHPYHTAGVYYVQDPSAMAAGILLDPQPGEWVLDLAAAPGGKATHIAARMQNQGVLVANDVVRRRASVLAMNLERMGVANALIANEYPERLAERWGGIFDAVLVDAPCSGEGTFSRDKRSVNNWSIGFVNDNAYGQRAIMEHAAALVRPGGRLLYGTCTFSPEEDEGVIAAFLAEHSEFEVMDLPALPGLHPGHPEWIDAPDNLRGVGRFWPHKSPGHGHFYALLRRKDGDEMVLPQKWVQQDVPGRVLRMYTECLADALVTPPPQEGLLLSSDDQLYITPLDPDLWAGLRILRPGWWVASLRHNKINLDHALAMALQATAVRMTVSLSPDDPRIRKFLLGGFWPDKGPDGWVWVSVDGFPLGWGKRGGGRLRSRYPIHLRRG